MEYFVPRDTSKLFESGSLEYKKIDNFALRLNRFVRVDLFNIKNEYEGISFSTNNEIQRVDKYYDSLKNLSYEQDSIFVKNDWKLTLGMGSGSVYNTSMTLHHIYGVPYLPAQSIKGAFRSYILQSYFTDELFSEKYKDKYSKFEDEVLYKCNWFVDIFGSNDREGKVLFFDAFSKDFTIVKDIMTPHYGEYYNKDKAPTDTQNPTPINFLAVENASFKICFASKENYEIKDGVFKGKKVLEMIQEQLTDSLEVFGIGGKTSVGYGYFSKESEPKSPLEREWDIAKETKNPKILEDFIKNNPSSKYDELAKEKLKLLIEKIEDDEKNRKKNKFQEIEHKAKKQFDDMQKKKGSKGFDKAKNNFIKKWSKEKENKGSEYILGLLKELN